MKIGFLGTDYKRSPLSDIELIYLKRDSWPLLCQRIKDESPINEIVILATCNRFEMYYTTHDGELAAHWLTAFIADSASIPRTMIEGITYSLKDDDVIRHLFNVSAGVESMVFGEDEILSQIKNSYTYFQELGATGPITNKLFQSAIGVGKRVRHETEISRGAYSVSSIAIDAIKEHQWDYFEKSILIIGTGTIGNRAIKKLVSMGHPSTTICNRTQARADEIAQATDVSVLPFSQLETSVSQFHIVIVATAASDYLIHPKLFLEDSITTLIIDLTVPRNVDPETENNTRAVIAVDGLIKIADRNVMKRQKESTKIKLILEDEQVKFQLWCERRLQHTR